MTKSFDKERPLTLTWFEPTLIQHRGTWILQGKPVPPAVAIASAFPIHLFNVTGLLTLPP